MAEVQGENGVSIFDSIIEDIVSKNTNEENNEPEKKDVTEDLENSDDLDEPITNRKNAEIRLKKFKNQRNEARNKVIELERQLAEMKGKVSVLEKPIKEVDQKEEDPTEYMTENEKFLFNENKKLKEELSEFTKFVSESKKEKKVNQLSEREKIFFKNNPELENNLDIVSEKIESYLKGKPFLVERVINNELSFDELWALISVNDKNDKVVRKVQDPDKVFSKSNNIATGIKESTHKQNSSKYSEAVSEYRKTNSKQAHNDVLNSATEHILDFLKNK